MFPFMPSIQLSTDLSDALLSLLSTDEKLVDAVEVGPWFTAGQIGAYRQMLPRLPFYFHAADLIEELGPNRLAYRTFRDYQACTQSPWISVHLSVWQPGEVRSMKAGQHVSLPDEERSRQQFIEKVKRLARSIQVPILIENVEPLPIEGYNFWADRISYSSYWIRPAAVSCWTPAMRAYPQKTWD